MPSAPDLKSRAPICFCDLSYFFTPQSDTDRLPSFQEGSCRRRRLRGVGVRQEVGLCRTTANEFLQIWCFPNNPSGAPRQLPLHKGAMSLCDFRLCAAEKTKGKFKTSTPKAAGKRKSRTLLQSLRDSSLPEGAFVCVCFFLCATEKTKGIFRTSKPKVGTLFFCGSAVRHYMPSSGRKVARVSVTEGACETENRHILLFLHRSLFPQRLPSFQEGSCRRRRLRGVEGSEGSGFVPHNRE